MRRNNLVLLLGFLIAIFIASGCVTNNQLKKSASQGIALSNGPAWAQWTAGNTYEFAVTYYAYTYTANYNGDASVKQARAEARKKLSNALNVELDEYSCVIKAWVDNSHKVVYVVAFTEKEISVDSVDAISLNNNVDGYPIWTKWDTSEQLKTFKVAYMGSVAKQIYGKGGNKNFSKSAAGNQAARILNKFMNRDEKATTGISQRTWADTVNCMAYGLAYIEISQGNQRAQNEAMANNERAQAEKQKALEDQQEAARTALKVKEEPAKKEEVDEPPAPVKQVNSTDSEKIFITVPGDRRVKDYQEFLNGLVVDHPEISAIYVVNVPGIPLQINIRLKNQTHTFTGPFDSIKAEIGKNPIFAKKRVFSLNDNPVFKIRYTDEHYDFVGEYSTNKGRVTVYIYVKPKGSKTICDVYYGEGATKEDAITNSKKQK